MREKKEIKNEKKPRFKKILFLTICLAICIIVLFTCSVKTKAANNSSYQRTEYVQTIESNDSTMRYFNVFSINDKLANTDNIDYSLFSMSYIEDNTLWTKTYYFNKQVGYTGDYFIKNTNVDLHANLFYLFVYGNDNKMCYIYLLTFDNNNNFVVDHLIWSELAEWYSGQLSEYTNKTFYYYGNNLMHYYESGGFASNNTTYINNVLRNYYSAGNFGEYYNEGYDDGYDDGEDYGYNLGYADGQATVTDLGRAFNLISGIFGTIGAVFAVEIVPHVPLGIFLLVPLFFGVVGLILWIWRRN